MTISSGNTRVNADDTSIESMIARADGARYRARAAGRKRVHVAAGAAPVVLQPAGNAYRVAPDGRL